MREKSICTTTEGSTISFVCETCASGENKKRRCAGPLWFDFQAEKKRKRFVSGKREGKKKNKERSLSWRGGVVY